MTKEELDRIKRAEEIQRYTENRCEALEKENAELKEINTDLKQSLDWANERESENAKRITELEEQISILLSCKNCPENKGGYICEKEYEGKCLSQKTQYTKELQEENAKLKEQNNKAKELLTRFVMASAYFNGKETDLVEQAEQFIKESK